MAYGSVNVPGSDPHKQDKLTGKPGQIVGFGKDGSAVAQAAPDTGVTSFKGRSGAVVPMAGDYTAKQVGAADANHTHTASQVGAAAVNHTHTAAQVGAADANHTHTAAQVGAAAVNHTHTASQVGAADANHTHTAEQVGAAAVNHTHTANKITFTLGGSGGTSGNITDQGIYEIVFGNVAIMTGYIRLSPGSGTGQINFTVSSGHVNSCGLGRLFMYNAGKEFILKPGTSGCPVIWLNNGSREATWSDIGSGGWGDLFLFSIF